MQSTAPYRRSSRPHRQPIDRRPMQKSRPARRKPSFAWLRSEAPLAKSTIAIIAPSRAGGSARPPAERRAVDLPPAKVGHGVGLVQIDGIRRQFQPGAETVLRLDGVEGEPGIIGQPVAVEGGEAEIAARLQSLGNRCLEFMTRIERGRSHIFAIKKAIFQLESLAAAAEEPTPIPDAAPGRFQSWSAAARCGMPIRRMSRLVRDAGKNGLTFITNARLPICHFNSTLQFRFVLRFAYVL